MIIDITTGFIPCTGPKPGRPWPCVSCSRAAARAHASSIPTREGHGGHEGHCCRGGEQTMAAGAPAAPATWGFPVSKNLCCRSDCSVRAQLLTHQKKNPSQPAARVFMCARPTYHLPGNKELSRESTADTQTILSLNNTFTSRWDLNYKSPVSQF